MVTKNIKKILEKQHYVIVGRHSAVQVCRWTKKALIDRGFCYKQKFYGIKSHMCCQMSPYMACPNECVHCWRPIELDFGLNLKPTIKGKIDKPKKIIENCISAQRKMLSGFGGNAEINMKKFKEAQDPQQFAISLIGEPTLYPYLSELIKELHKHKKSSFLVSNGLFPEKLKQLQEEEALPTQLYISLNTPNKELYEKWHKSKIKDAWKKFNQSLSLMKNFKTRTVLRMTLVKDLNIKEPENYAKLIKKASPDFVEVKSYMAVGFARKRLDYSKMLSHKEVKEFAKEILKFLTGYKILDEKKESRVVLLGKNKKKMKISKI